MTMQPPKASGRNISKAERSKFSDVENRNPRSSVSETIERPQEIRLIRLRCSMPTAFGCRSSPKCKGRKQDHSPAREQDRPFQFLGPRLSVEQQLSATVGKDSPRVRLLL